MTAQHPDTGKFVRDELAEITAAQAAGMAACEQRQAHLTANIAGQGAGAGDPRPAESALQPVIGAQVSVT